MNISELSIRRPVFAWMLMAGLIIFGGLAFKEMGVSQLPDVDFPVVNISVMLDGAAPEVMELDVVDPIESAVMAVEGIESMSSSSKSGYANITVEFALNKNIDVAVQEIQTKLSQISRQLPKDIDPPVVTKSNPEDQPILWMTVTSKTLPKPQLMSYVRDQLKDRFQTVTGVAEVFLGGYVDPNLRVWVDQKKLDHYDLTVVDVMNAIQSEHKEPPAGRLENTRTETNIRTMGEADGVTEFQKIAINRRGGTPNFVPTALYQVARIEDGLADIRRISRAMGIPAVGLAVKKQRGSNAVEVAKAVKERFKEIQGTLPPGVNLEMNFDTTRFIEDAVNELNFTLLLSAILTALVCWLFLGSISATINIILAIPTSIIGSFMVLRFLGFTLNTFTLLGLSLAIGIVVDDAIMVLENIVRHKEKGHDKLNAALLGSREIAFAALAATVAIIAIFLPVAFMKGIIGKYFFQFGVTISVAVALSLLEALTLTPMRCSQFLETGERKTRIGRFVEAAFEGSARVYKRCLPVLLRHRMLTIVSTLVLFAATLAVGGLLKMEMVPPQDQGMLIVRLKAPEGSSLEYTDQKMTQIESILKNRPEVQRFFGSVGGLGGGDVNTAFLFVTLKPLKERGINPEAGKRLTQQEFAQSVRKDFRTVNGVKIFLQDPSLSGFSAKRGFPVEFTIRGPDWNKLIELSEKTMDAMKKTGLMTDVDSDYQGNVDEIHVVPDRDRAKLRGVSVADIGQTISALMGGAIVGGFSKGGHRYDVRVKMAEDHNRKPDELKQISVRNNRGELIPLADLVTIVKTPGLRAISRQERERAVSVFANIAPKASQQAAIESIQKLSKELMPEGYRLVVGGSAKTFGEARQGLLLALLLGLLISYMVLASQFNSFIHPLTVLLALPFSLSGALVALYLGNQSLSIYGAIGIILLMGIVKKNSILLVDFTNQKREQGLSINQALVEACPIRLRPILMTSFATITGAIPPAMALGPGAESRIPMALAIIGGVLFSTLLTLFVVPCFYSLVSREHRAVRKSEPLWIRKPEAAVHGTAYPLLESSSQKTRVLADSPHSHTDPSGFQS